MRIILKKKAEENLKAGKLLFDKAMFNASIHCYYYSCLQLMKFVILDKFGFTIETVDRQTESGNSHNWIINKIKELYLEKYDYSYSRIFSKDIKRLKNLRKDADYNLVEIDKDKTIEADNLTCNIFDYFKRKNLI